MPSRRFVLALAILCFALSVPAAGRGEDGQADRSDYRLIVVLIVDQFRYDYLQRFAPLFKQGLRRLVTEGASFKHAAHAHALTETCPGHAALITGVHPARSGIVENEWLDRAGGSDVYCVADKKFRRSPRNLLVDGLGDWLKRERPGARVFSVSGKDRAAIVLGGRHPDGVYWYDRKTGAFVTSAYYPEPPAWVAGFNRTQGAARFFGQRWRALPVPAEAARNAKVVTLDRGVLHDGFPHALGPGKVKPTAAFFDAVYRSPLLDEQTGDFLYELIDRERLGAGAHTDLLAVSFSALDLVGHRYGPNSREVMDTLLRLDALIGALLDRIEKAVGKEHALVLFSADHGVAPLPEYLRTQGIAARRADAEDIACLQRARGGLAAHFKAGKLFKQGLMLDREAVARLGVSRAALDRMIRERLEACEAVRRVWTRSELTEDPPVDDPWFTAYRNSLHPDRGPDYFIQYREYYQPVQGTGTGHGSPYGYDTRVPLIFWGGGIAARTLNEPVATVDAAPTLAALAGLRGPESLDGRDRAAQVR